MIWDETVDLAVFTQAVREDLPDTPNPILDAVAARVVREFCEKTFCLVQEIDGEVTFPEGLEPDLEFVAAEIKETEGGNIVIMKDNPPGKLPTSGRITDVGGQTWTETTMGPYTISMVSCPSSWTEQKATMTFPGGLSNGTATGAVFGSTATATGGGMIQLIPGTGTVQVVGYGDSGEFYNQTFDFSGASLDFSFSPSGVVTISPITATVDFTGQAALTGDHFGMFTGIAPSFVPFACVEEVSAFSTQTASKSIITDTPTAVPWLPSLTNPLYPKALVEWDEYIKAGILFELQAQPGKPWSSAGGVVLNNRVFQLGIGKAKAEWFRLYGVAKPGRPIC